MALKVDISSKIDKFKLELAFQTKANRIGILGESGAGKSMLLKYIAGIYQPEVGKIELDDTLLLDTDNKVNVIPQKRNIAYMFQNYALFSTMSVRENIEIVVKGDKTSKKAKADFLLQKFHLEKLASKKPAELSGGEQQRVALARVLAYEPKLILLDEPFSALDQNLKENLQIELENMIKDYDGTVIMVSHSRDELYKFSDEIIIISDGKLLEMGGKKELFTMPKTVKGARLLGVNNILAVNVISDKFLALRNALAKGFNLGLYGRLNFSFLISTCYIIDYPVIFGRFAPLMPPLRTEGERLRLLILNNKRLKKASMQSPNKEGNSLFTFPLSC